MKSAAIFYFSGTGNTEIIAVMLKEELEKRQYSAELVRIEDVLKNKIAIDINKYDLIGIGSQVIGFTAPIIVNKFIRVLPKTKGKKVFVFRTAGGVAPVNYNASKPMIRKLARKGYDVFYERLFSISSNWIKKFDDSIIVKLHEAARRKAGLMCDSLISGENRVLKTGIFQKILMECVMFISPMFFRFVGMDYIVSESCTHCGLCIKNCPSNNIVENNGRIKFKMSCYCCMRCIYSCPKNAIKLRKFAFFKIPEGYNIMQILSRKSNSCETTKAEPPFFKGYIENDSL